MPKEDTVVKENKVKFKGTFDLSLLYRKLRDWLIREKYSDPCQAGERKYSEKIKPNGKQVEIVWESSKGFQAGYYKIVIKLSFFLDGINEVDVERNGRKIKLENGGIEIIFNSSIIRNADNKWNENSMMFKLYERYIIRNQIEGVKIECYKDTNKLIAETKNFFNLYR